MGSQSLAVVLATLSLLAIGCDASVKLNSATGDRGDPVVIAEETPEETPEEVVANAKVDVVVEAEPTVVGIDDFQKGKRLRDSQYGMSRAMAVRFTAEQKYILINKNHALQLYNAEHGNYPKTHEEFMAKIIQFNKLQLPELGPGYEYLYKPEDPMNLYKQRTGEPDEA